MSWRDDPRTAPYWIEFADLLLAAHPEWAPFVLGVQERRGMEMFLVEIPSAHPTIHEPLTIEVADREPGGPIDTYWNGYFEHNFCGRDKGRWREQIAAMIARVDTWMSDEWIFRQHVEPRGGRRVHGPIRYGDGTRVTTDEMPFVQWSWRGTHDATG